MARVWRVAVAGWKWLVGGALCNMPPGALIVLGWTYRLMGRAVVKSWWRTSPLAAEGDRFDDFVQERPQYAALRRWPNWMLRQEASASMRSGLKDARGISGRVRVILGAVFHSLGQNLKIGLQGIFNLWVFTWPGCVIMALAWWAGWNNSFNKGYEQSEVGPALGVLGMALFVAAMFYVPMAQARQASTGRWKSFYQLNLIWRLIRCRPIANLVLAGCYAAAAGLVLISVVAVTFLPMIRPDIDVMTDATRLQFIESYYFRVCLFGFLLYAGLHVLTARIYAGAVVKAIRTGAVSLDELNDDERELLGVLGLSCAAESERAGLIRASVNRTARWTFRTAVAGLTILIWLAFSFQIFVAQFMNYRSQRGWLNQPLVHLPWFSHVPEKLKALVQGD